MQAVRSSLYGLEWLVLAASGGMDVHLMGDRLHLLVHFCWLCWHRELELPSVEVGPRW